MVWRWSPIDAGFIEGQTDVVGQWNAEHPRDQITLETLAAGDIADISYTALPDGSFLISGDPVGVNRESQPRPEIKGKDITLNQADSPWQIVYGYMRVGGIFSFLNLRAGVDEYLHVVITVAGHKINNVYNVYIEGIQPTFGGGGIHPGDPQWGSGDWADHIFWSTSSLGDDDQPANAQLVGQSNILFPGKWTEAHRQRGRAHVYMILKYNPVLFPQWPPKITFDIEGKADIYDPRSATTGYTNNAALVLADYLCDPVRGLGADYDTEIDETNLIEAANICDETVVTNAGSESRYTINTVYDASESPINIINKMLTAMGGDLSWSNGKWKIFPATWRPPTITLTEDDLRSPVLVQSKFSKRDLFNRVKGVFLSPNNNWEIADFPAVVNALYLSEDGEEIWQDITLPCTTSAATCQRLAKIFLERIRQGIQVQIVTTLKAYQLQVCDVVNLTFEKLGWNGKPFEVRGMRFALSTSSDAPEALVQLTLRETASGVFDWNNGEETTVDLAPNTDLPDPTDISQPTNLELFSGTDELYIRADGTVFSRIRATWDISLDPFVVQSGHYEIQYKQSSSPDWIDATSIPGSSNFTYILDVQDNQYYDVRVRAVSGLGFASDYTTVTGHLVLGKTEPPSNVVGFVGAIDGYNIRLQWLPISDIDLSHYEIRLGPTSWDDSDTIWTGTATTLLYPVQVAGAYKFWIRAVDTSGNLSTIAATVTINLNVPTAPNVTFQISGPNVVLSWTESVSQFALQGYLIYQGPAGSDISGANQVAFTQSTIFSLHVAFGGTQRFFVRALDVAGNLGTPGSVDVTIISPSAVVGLNSQVIDNNVLLRWSAPSTGTLPIDHYKVYKGATFAGATLQGQVSGTFFPFQELSAGSFTYWVVPYDTALNAGPESGVTAVVSQPPDYVLLDDRIVDVNDLSLYKVLTIVENDTLVAPVVLSETFEEHFTTNSWNTPQDQIDAGYPIFVQPSAVGVAYAEIEYDYGAVIPSSLITLSWLEELIDGSVTVSPTISYSEDGGSYTTVNTSSVFASDFRYVRIRLSIEGADRTSLIRISQIRLRLDVKTSTEDGVVLADENDSSGTPVMFVKNFIDVTNIQLTAQYNASYPEGVTPLYDFVDIPYPTQMFVYAFDNSDGSRATNLVSYTIKGIVAPA